MPHPSERPKPPDPDNDKWDDIIIGGISTGSGNARVLSDEEAKALLGDDLEPEKE